MILQAAEQAVADAKREAEQREAEHRNASEGQPRSERELDSILTTIHAFLGKGKAASELIPIAIEAGKDDKGMPVIYLGFTDNDPNKELLEKLKEALKDCDIAEGLDSTKPPYLVIKDNDKFVSKLANINLEVITEKKAAKTPPPPKVETQPAEQERQTPQSDIIQTKKTDEDKPSEPILTVYNKTLKLKEKNSLTRLCRCLKMIKR